MTAKDREANQVIRDVETDILGATNKRKPKKENNKVKNFFKKIQTIIVLTIIFTLAAVYGAYSLYNFVYTKGYQDAVSEREAISKQVAELSKTKQQ